MKSLVLDEDYRTVQALTELDRKLPTTFPVITLNVLGGFALQIHKIRTDHAQATDIDYLGDSLPASVRELVNAIGKKYQLEPGWLNNDLMLTGITIEDFMSITGELHFLPIQTNLRHFRVNVASVDSLLNMKLQSIDTNLMAETIENRPQDFTDIEKICHQQHLDFRSLSKRIDQLSAGDPPLIILPTEVKAILKDRLNLPEPELAAAYEDAFNDWDNSADAAFWDDLIADGLGGTS